MSGVRNHCFVLVFVLFAIPLTAQDATPIVLGESRLRHSTILDGDVQIQISLPESYNRSKHRFPLLIVLDGSSQFEQTAVSARHLAASGAIPDLIVVGVTTTSRSRDFTTPPGPDFSYPPFIRNPGGAATMHRYLRDELIPALESAYRCAPFRLIHGHSLGGLYVAWQLLEDPSLFYGYLLLDPSLFWNNNEIPIRAAAELPGARELKAAIFCAAGGPPESADEKPFPPMQQWLDALSACGSPNLRSTFQRFPGYGHNQMPGPATYAALRWILSDFQYSLSPQSTPALFLEHYRRLSAERGYEVVPTETEISNYLFFLVFEQKEAEFATLFDTAIGWYPESYALLYYRGELLLKLGKREEALAVYRRALAQKPDSLAIRARVAELTAPPLP